MKWTKLLVVVSLLLMVTACEKTEVEPTPTDGTEQNSDETDQNGETDGNDTPTISLEDFCGTYNIQVDVVENYVNDMLSDGELSHYDGQLFINMGEDQSSVDITSSLTISGQSGVALYNTRATLSEDGQLVPESSVYTNPATTLDLTVEYGAITLADTLNFESSMSAYLGGYDFTYVMRNVAVRTERKR